MRDPKDGVLFNLATDIIIYTTAAALALFWLGLLVGVVVLGYKLVIFAVSL